jgi:hypothetical protein
MIFHFFKSRLGILVVLVLLFAGIWNGILGNIQKYSQVLGSTANSCSSKLDLNCDNQTDSGDLATLVKVVGSSKPKPSPSPTPTPSTCGNKVCDLNETAISCSVDCSTLPSPTPSPSTTSAPTPAPS